MTGATSGSRSASEREHVNRTARIGTATVDGAIELEPLLKVRMRVAATVIFVAMTAFLARDLSLEKPHAVPIRVAYLAFLATMLVPLWRKQALRLDPLRLIEAAVFGATALWVGYDSTFHMLKAAAEADQIAFVATADALVFFSFALTVGYGVFVPNALPRATVAIALLGAVPFAALAVIIAAAPRESEAFLSSVQGTLATSLLIQTTMGVAVAIAGARVINGLRQEAHDARQLGQYTLRERIGGGGIGEVWRAEHRFLARPAAIKLIRRELVDGGNPSMFSAIERRFEREAQVTASLRSPHTVDLYDFGRSQSGAFYYVMELLDGLDLEALVERHGPQPAERSIELLIQACDSLHEAHALGLVHRDIKPANIVVSPMGRTGDFVKVLDFGLVRQSVRDPEETRVTVQGTAAGTPAFMAPEMIVGNADDHLDGRADLYALGCVGYWLLTGHPVFDADSAMSMAVAHARDEPSPASSRTEIAVPQSLDALLLSCLQKAPADRPATAEVLAQRLAAIDTEPRWDSERARSWWRDREGAAQ